MMPNAMNGPVRDASLVTLSLLAWNFGALPAEANPTATGGTVVQGSATFNTSGSQFTINQTSANALINWQNFNIGTGETTTFVQPSSSSVTWNQINGSSPSQILGTLNANGYVILQNQAGFYVGGNAAISAHGLVMTTSPTPAPTLSSGGAWEFDTPPVGADIINYGKISIAGGGSAFLIADSIQNFGTIQAEQGKIGLYDGEQVLLSSSPDGRGISAKVTLPKGSVDNEGNLIADGGAIAAMAQTVNQNGLVQANSVQNVNGVIELVASGDLNIGTVPNAANPNPTPDMEANGDSNAGSEGIASPGGFVVLKGANYSDISSSKINVAGQNGGQNGIVEVFGNNLTDASSLNSQIGNAFALWVNPYDVTISSNPTDTTTPAFNSQNPAPFNPNVNVSDLSAYAQIDLHALDNFELSTYWTLNDPSVNNAGAWGTLSLNAGNSIILDDGSSIGASQNWSLNLLAGTSLAAGATPLHISDGTQYDGVYLLGSAYLQTGNGDINVQAANEVQINTDSATDFASGIRTLNGGNINVSAEFGDVNTGGNSKGFDYNATAAPYYTVDPLVGGISTAAGGNVTINAGGNVTSYLPNGSDTSDAGTGAFGPEAGNVSITAGGSVYGHYMIANGQGTITAQGGDVGASSSVEAFALSLIAGGWTVNAPNGNIYLQEVRNPNGVFNNLVLNRRGQPTQLAGSHLFNYAANASVSFNAGDGFYLTELNLPRPNDNVQVILPPEVSITAGAGGVNLNGNVTLYPSADQNLSVSTSDGGNLVEAVNGYTPYELLMSDSAASRWTSSFTFGDQDHGPLSAEPTDPTPVNIDISGNLENLFLITSKETQVQVGGNMINCAFSGQNLHANGVTSITVNGQIFNQSAYNYVDGVTISSSSIPSSDVPAGVANTWDTIFTLALNPDVIKNLTVPSYVPQSQYLAYALEQASLLGVGVAGGVLSPNAGDQGFSYNATTDRLWYSGPMQSSLLSELLGANSSGQFTVLHLVNGAPVLDSNGHFETDSATWVAPSALATLYQESQSAPQASQYQYGYRVGGPGQFDVTAGSISLGSSFGILSCGDREPQPDTTLGNRYDNLASLTPSSADLNVTVTGPDQTGTVTVDGATILPHASLDMLTATIASLGGGSVSVDSLAGSMDLGAQLFFDQYRPVGLGVLTTAGGDVTLKANGDINIDGSRVATYDGGDIFIESYAGSVDVGSGGANQTGAYLSYSDGGVAGNYQEYIFGSGIVANTLVPAAPASLTDGLYSGYPPSGSSVTIAKTPGNITVLTPQGDIKSTLGGITQEALDGSTTAGPTIDLEAGSDSHVGNIDLGKSGVIGGSVTIKATGSIKGPIISRQNATVQAVGSFSGSVLSGGKADVSGSSVSGVIVGVGGVSVSGTVNAEVLGQNVSVNGGAGTSTLGTTASATAASGSAAQQASNDAKQEVAGNGNGDDDDKKRKKQALLQRVKRVTVILPKKS